MFKTSVLGKQSNEPEFLWQCIDYFASFNDIDLIDLPALGRTFWYGMSTLYWITCHEIFGDGNIWSIIQKVFVEV